MTDNAKTALITGASRGLGLALARTLVARGWNLIIDSRGAEPLEAVRAELAGLATVTAVPGDVTDKEHGQALAEAAHEAGGLDVLVNNASILGPSPQPELLDYPIEVLEEVYRANVIAPLALIQSIRSELKPEARILNITSDAAVEPYEGWGGYGSSKAALEQLSNILAAENPDLRVYRVDPGDMRTRMHQEAFPDEDISDRPPPEESVPGLLKLLTDDLPSGRYRVQDFTTTGGPTTGIHELRVALTVEDLDEAVALYRDALGLSVVKEWSQPEGRGLILDAGPASIELVDQAQAEHIDRIEVGERVSDPMRLAFGVSNIEAWASSLQDGGAQAVGGPVHTPWGDLNQRFQAPDGAQLTLFQSAAERPAEKEVV